MGLRTEAHLIVRSETANASKMRAEGLALATRRLTSGRPRPRGQEVSRRTDYVRSLYAVNHGTAFKD
jgi:hypothetical protein